MSSRMPHGFRRKIIGASICLLSLGGLASSVVHAGDAPPATAPVQIELPTSPCDCAAQPRGVRGFFHRWRDGILGQSDNSRTLPSGLPRGRTYFQGRYFGNFNNRLYGPQYGYF